MLCAGETFFTNAGAARCGPLAPRVHGVCAPRSWHQHLAGTGEGTTRDWPQRIMPLGLCAWLSFLEKVLAHQN